MQRREQKCASAGLWDLWLNIMRYMCTFVCGCLLSQKHDVSYSQGTSSAKKHGDTHERLEGNVSKMGEETNAYFNRVGKCRGLSEAKVHNVLDLMPTLLKYVLVTCAYLLI